MFMHIETQETTIAGIPLLEITPYPARKLPVILFHHGFSSHKADAHSLGKQAASAGFALLAVDAPMHGARLDERIRTTWDKPMTGDIYPFETGLDRFHFMFQLIDQTVDELPRLLTGLAQDPRLDLDRLGICGVSMGGLITYLAAARLPQFKAAVAMMAYPMFALRWQDVTLEATSYPQWSERMQQNSAQTAERLAFFESIDPIEGLKTFAPRPLMMVVGDQDLDAPKSYTVQGYRTLLPAYSACPERLRLNIQDKTPHRMTQAIILDTIAWFSRFLSPPQCAGDVPANQV
jgi:pimeloyl-ACP methyl ester carboxylesterase